MEKSTRRPDIFTARLRKAREIRGLDQSVLAERAGLQPSAISHFETGARKPSFDNLRRLADALDVTTDYLLGRVDDIDSYAGADRLHRHFEKMTSADRQTAEDILKLLASKSTKRSAA
jgi:transcriptional regulator with XRE-family HTH domain